MKRSGTTSFILLAVFTNFMGIGIINPVLPFIVNRYAPGSDGAFVAALLFAAFALCQFFAVPLLGALSDRYGRRPVLLVSLLGSAVGYWLFGIGGALWVLFFARAVDGLTGGNISTIYAFAADVTTSEERTRFFGLLGAASSTGFIVGPAIGSVVYRLSGTVDGPVFFAALLMTAITLWGWFVMPESLPVDRRDPTLNARKLNPFTQLRDVLLMPELRLYLLATFLWALSFAMLQSNLSYMSEDRLGLDADGVGIVFFSVGAVGAFTQGYLIRRLLVFTSEARLSQVGLALIIVGFLLVAALAATRWLPLMVVAVLCTASGNGLVTAALSGLMSRTAGAGVQGRVQGGSQAAQALGRVIGPTWGGWSYTYFGASAPYLTGAVGLSAALFALTAAVRNTGTDPAPGGGD